MKSFLIFLVLFLVASLHGESSDHSASTVEIAGLRFTVPKNWVDAKPLSPMRAAQWGVPVPKSAEGGGEVVAFYFGPGQGGDAKSNIDRWLTEMTTPEGSPAQGDVTVRKVQGLSVTQLVVLGTYTNAMAFPGLPPAPRPGFGLVGAVVEGPSGAIFF